MQSQLQRFMNSILLTKSKVSACHGQGQCESVVGQTPHTPRHQNVAARRATAQLSKPARAERARSRLPDALLWSLKFAENLSFRSASVATHTHTSSPLANCPTTDSHCDGHGGAMQLGFPCDYYTI